MLRNTPHSLFDLYRLQTYPHCSLEWIRARDFISFDPSNFLCEGNLWECSEGKQSFNHYILTRDALICIHVAPPTDDILEGLKAKGTYIYYMNLMAPKVRKIKECKKYGFSLVMGQEIRKFLCSSKEEMLDWCEWLKDVCVLEDMEAKYDLGKIIGSGTSAYVRSAKNKRNLKEFAIKSFLKLKLADKPYALVLIIYLAYIIRSV